MEDTATQDTATADDQAAEKALLAEQEQEHIESLDKVGGAMRKAGVALKSEDVGEDAGKDDARGKGKDDAAGEAKPPKAAKGKADEGADADADAPVALTPRQKEAGRQLKLTGETMRAMTPEALKATEEAGMKLRKAHSAAGQKPPKKKDPGDAEPGEAASDDDGAGEKGSATAGEEANKWSADDWYTEDGATKLNTLIEDVEALKTAGQENSEEQGKQQADEWFAKLDEKVFGETYGQGKTADLEEDSNESLARNELLDKAATCRKVAAADGTPLTASQALDMALGMLYPDKMAEQERVRIEQEVKDRKDQLSARPSQRRRKASKTGSRAEALEQVGDAMDKADIPRR